MTTKYSKIHRGIQVAFFATSMLTTSVMAEPYDKFVAKSVPENQVLTGTFQGVVHEVSQSGGYTFLRMTVAGKEVWAATMTTAVPVHHTVTYQNPLIMKGFHSKSLNKTFDEILFISQVTVAATPAPATGSTAK